MAIPSREARDTSALVELVGHRPDAPLQAETDAAETNPSEPNGLRAAVRDRAVRARLAMPGVPLAIIAAILGEQWWTLPVFAVCAWWWGEHEPKLRWVLAVAWGVVGAEWALVGASALATFPDDRLATGACWVLAALPPVVIGLGARLWDWLERS